jgi:hypothetical protein
VVTGVHRAWHTHGDPRPLSERWAEVATQLVRLGGREIGPRSETALLDMRQEIVHRTPASVWDAALAGAQGDFINEVTRHQQLRAELLRDQRGLERLQQTPEHAILGGITGVMMEPPEETQAVCDRLFGRAPSRYLLPGEVNKPTFLTVSENRQATREMSAANDDLRDALTRVAAVFHHESLGLDSQNRRLILSQQRSIDMLETRLRALEQYAGNETAGALERQQRSTTTTTTRRKAS